MSNETFSAIQSSILIAVMAAVYWEIDGYKVIATVYATYLFIMIAAGIFWSIGETIDRNKNKKGD